MIGRSEPTESPGRPLATGPAGLAGRRRPLRLVDPFPEMPVGFRAADFAGVPRDESHVPLTEAAARMDVPRATVLALVEDGTLDAVGSTRGSLRVRPAIVSVLRVVDRREP